jgi:D-alanyl-D-alanine carboxypeptidase
MKARRVPSARFGLFFIAAIWLIVIVPLSAMAAPYAAYVMDARTGKVIHARNADTRLHPASLTKMMTL